MRALLVMAIALRGFGAMPVLAEESGRDLVPSIKDLVPTVKDLVFTVKPLDLRIEDMIRVKEAFWMKAVKDLRRNVSAYCLKKPWAEFLCPDELALRRDWNFFLHRMLAEAVAGIVA